jgi:hypothetical protein
MSVRSKSQLNRYKSLRKLGVKQMAQNHSDSIVESFRSQGMNSRKRVHEDSNEVINNSIVI